ncbi:helix-turn-helix domain-containing protein [Micromonospora sp. NPDC047753]|uniref:helix-turn-helix domain-containing protein n=1 Tax=Micromonospora sp. NPDC047753 TaxID=3154817 RepID=UPI0033E38C8C
MTNESRAVPNPTDEPTISVKRAAAILGISVRHAYVAIERGGIPSIRVGRKVVVPTARFLTKYNELV